MANTSHQQHLNNYNSHHSNHHNNFLNNHHLANVISAKIADHLLLTSAGAMNSLNSINSLNNSMNGGSSGANDSQNNNQNNSNHNNNKRGRGRPKKDNEKEGPMSRTTLHNGASVAARSYPCDWPHCGKSFTRSSFCQINLIICKPRHVV